MIGVMREKLGKGIVATIIALIAAVFVFYGVFSPKATRGLHEGSVAGKVNGDAISLSEFNREYNRRIEFFKQMMGNANISEEQLAAFRVKQGVFDEIVRRKLLVQEARKAGMLASDEEVRDRIQKMPYFQKDGKFDLATYKQVIQANNLTPDQFERMMREDLSQQAWQQHFANRVHVSDREIKDQFQVTADRRNIKYVLVTTEVGKKGIAIEPAQVEKFLADPTKLNLAKSQYEQRKELDLKGKTFDQVKEALAKDFLAGDHLDEVKKINDRLASQVLSMMTVDKASDTKINAVLKPYGAEVKSTGMISRLNPFVPGIGQAPELVKDAFSQESPIASKAKRYDSGAWSLVAVISGTEKPESSKFDAERDKIQAQLLQAKERELFEGWMSGLAKKASIEKNPDVVGASGPAEEG